jgi:hypothetical protein
VAFLSTSVCVNCIVHRRAFAAMATVTQVEPAKVLGHFASKAKPPWSFDRTSFAAMIDVLIPHSSIENEPRNRGSFSTGSGVDEARSLRIHGSFVV